MMKFFDNFLNKKLLRTHQKICLASQTCTMKLPNEKIFAFNDFHYFFPFYFLAVVVFEYMI